MKSAKFLNSSPWSKQHQVRVSRTALIFTELERSCDSHRAIIGRSSFHRHASCTLDSRSLDSRSLSLAVQLPCCISTKDGHAATSLSVVMLCVAICSLFASYRVLSSASCFATTDCLGEEEVWDPMLFSLVPTDCSTVAEEL